MLNFDPGLPYPLISDGSFSYAEAQAHSEWVDAWLGLKTEETETRLRLSQPEPSENAPQLWTGLPVRSMLTPYTEIREILHRLEPAPHTTMIDLGAGYGRMGFVVGTHYPHCHWVGYEWVLERVLESKRCLAKFNFPNIEIVHADLENPGFMPRAAEFYFLYDFGTRLAIEKTLSDLQKIAKSQAVTVVGRGRASRDAIERRHPWLSEINAPEHFSHYSIYRS